MCNVSYEYRDIPNKCRQIHGCIYIYIYTANIRQQQRNYDFRRSFAATSERCSFRGLDIGVYYSTL